MKNPFQLPLRWKDKPLMLSVNTAGIVVRQKHKSETFLFSWKQIIEKMTGWRLIEDE